MDNWRSSDGPSKGSVVDRRFIVESEGQDEWFDDEGVVCGEGRSCNSFWSSSMKKNDAMDKECSTVLYVGGSMYWQNWGGLYINIPWWAWFLKYPCFWFLEPNGQHAYCCIYSFAFICTHVNVVFFLVLDLKKLYYVNFGVVRCSKMIWSLINVSHGHYDRNLNC